jgi:type 1 glutamine amidotransferase
MIIDRTSAAGGRAVPLQERRVLKQRWIGLGAAAVVALALGLLPAVQAEQAAPAAPASTPAAAPKKVLFFTKSAGFQHSCITRKGDELSHAEKVMVELGPQHGFDITCTKDGSVFTKEGLAPYDLIMFYTTGDLTKEGTDKQPPMPADGKQVLLDAVAAGKGFVGFHCASDTFHSGREVDPYIKMLGGEFASHGAQQKSTSHVCDKAFPGLADAGESFELHEEWYAFRNLNKAMHVLLLQDTTGMKGEQYEGKPNYPGTWARMHDQGRVWYTSMGHREDVWTNPLFQKIVLGGMDWAARNVDAEVPSNTDQVCPGIATVE